MFSYMILLLFLTGQNECVLCKIPYMSKSKSSITNNTVRKDVPTSHQRVQSSKLVLNRKQNAFQTHLT